MYNWLRVDSSLFTLNFYNVVRVVAKYALCRCRYSDIVCAANAKIFCDELYCP